MANGFLKTLNARIGGYQLPADFQCLNLKFLKELSDLSFEDRIKSIYAFVFGNDLIDGNFSSIKDCEYPASVYGVDDNVSVLELFDGESCCYNDYVFGEKNAFFKVVSLAFTVVSAYVDLCDSGKINFGDKINVSSHLASGELLLSLYFCKMLKLPIETLIFATNKPVDFSQKGIYFALLESGDIEEITEAFFEETDYVLDPISAGGLASYDIFYSDYEDGLETLILALNSPYLFSRNLLKVLTGINELSVDKAIKKLEEFTAIEVPDCILSGKLQPFYKEIEEISVKDALEIIKDSN
jgi:hypothetical protein